MSRVFVSSVVGGMEAYRDAARQAITTMDHTPVMCEDFPARPYSSEKACLHEVEQSDIYLVIIGKDFGFETPEGLSVTQAEFRAAKETDKSILAFIQKTDDRDERQQAFLDEVEAYQAGVFRASFNSPTALNQEIIKALRHVESMSQAISEGEFKERIARVLDDSHSFRDDPQLIMAFLPQPERMVDIVSVEQAMDEHFSTLCQAGLTQLRNGYELLDHAHWTGLTSDSYTVYFCAEGLILLTCNPTEAGDGFFAGSFARPDKINRTAKGFRHLINAQSGYVHMALQNMDNTYVANPPEGNSMSMRMFASDTEADFSRLFMPLTSGNYDQWIDQCARRLERIFRYSGD